MAVGRGLVEAFFMFWQTLWALALGFVLSGAVQAFVSREQLRRVLGDHSPASIARAGVLGAASSSCSYAASALARSLFVRGADFTAATAFMVASTNLVVELGLVLWVLLGWQFALAELVGGIVMLALLGLLLPRALPASLVETARAHAISAGSGGGHGADDVGDAVAMRGRWRTRDGWSVAAGYTVGDLRMIRRELVVGFLVAGLLAEVVPSGFWRAFFLTGHGFLSSAENAVVGPVLACIAFVCSIGNVPLAAALWSGGIAFGGVVAFVYADLLALPLVLIYRRYYGMAVTLRLVGVLWLVMSVGGLITEYVFSAFDLVPSVRPKDVVETRFAWDHTTALNVVAVVVLIVVFALYRRARSVVATHAVDPVCGMQIEIAHAAATHERDGVTYHFCGEGCRDRFAASAVASTTGDQEAG